MNVCIDIQAAVTQTAGVGRYTRLLVEHLAPLAAAAGDPPLRLFYFDFRRQALYAAPAATDPRPWRRVPGRWIQTAWRTLRWPPYDALAGDADIFHFTNFIRPPLRRGRSIITIHDVGFLRFPHFTEARNLRRLSRALPESVARADAIVTISHFSAAEIRATLGVDPAKVHVTPLGVEPHFMPAPADAVAVMRKRLGLDRPYLLTVGTIEPRKNHVFLAEVFERLGTDFDGLLAIAGATGWRTEPILDRLHQSPRADSIRRLEHVPDALLPALYSGAEAFLFPSHYEGFGFPPLEAMACGTPAIVSEGGSLPEIMDCDAVMRPGSLDADAWAAAVRTVLTEDRDRRRARCDAGRRHAARFDWADTARTTWALYRSLTS